MKMLSWLPVYLGACLLGAAAGSIAAGEAPSPARTPPQELGVLAPVQAEVRVVVPKDGLWQAPESSFVCTESISVEPERGPALIRRDREPRQGQFSSQPGGALIFSAADVGRQFVVRYQFRPRRVALLDAASPRDDAEAQSLLGQALAEELGKHGFLVVPAPEVRDAAAALDLETISPRALPPPEKLAALAQKVNAAYALVPGLGIREHSRPGEFDTGIPIPEEWEDRRPGPFPDAPGRKGRVARPAWEEEPTLVLPITRSRLDGAARLAIVDGATGAVVGDVLVSDSQRVRLYRFSPARRSLVRRLAARVVAAWRAPAR